MTNWRLFLTLSTPCASKTITENSKYIINEKFSYLEEV
jgi:hypothetical protein